MMPVAGWLRTVLARVDLRMKARLVRRRPAARRGRAVSAARPGAENGDAAQLRRML
jgi:hypothetical protein